jgi:predicted lipid-binding transport protein (Tim44 family)
MSSAVIQLLVLAGIAVFLILRLRSVLGTREGFEKPRVPDANGPAAPERRGPRLEVVAGGPDTDITDHVAEDSPAADALARMKRVEPDFGVGDFLHGARGAYEMILMSFENGTLDEILPFLSRDVYESFAEVVEMREAKGLRVEATFIGLREVKLVTASFDEDTGEAEMTVRFVAELSSVVRDQSGAIVDGDPNEIKRQRDVWTFARRMGVDDPNWQLVATGE